MADKEDMIERFEDLYSDLKMEVLSNSGDSKSNRQLFGQIEGFFLAMKMVVPLNREEIDYVEHRLRVLEERLV